MTAPPTSPAPAGDPGRPLAAPEWFNLGWHCSDRWVEAGFGHRPAIVAEDGVTTYRELAELSDRVGAVLRSCGVRRGDRFLIRLSGGPYAYATFLAGLKVGAVPVPTAVLLGERELEHIIAVADVRVAVVDAHLAGPVRAIRRRRTLPEHVLCHGRPETGELALDALVEGEVAGATAERTRAVDPAFVLFTSGTTGNPKGVVHAHRAYNVAAGNPCGRWAMGLTADDLVLQPHDLAWSYSLGCGFLFPLAEGAAVVAPGPSLAPGEITEQLTRHRPTVFASVPTLYRKLVSFWDDAEAPDLGSLRFAMSAGEPLPVALHRAWVERTRVDLLEHLGQVELNIFVANPPGRPSVPGSVGVPLPGYTVAVLDEDGAPCVGRTGALAVSADNPGLFVDYLGMPDRYRAAHRAGWYLAGDSARIDEAQRVWFVARSDELILSRGYSISPWEVEATLLEHPVVAEAAVVGLDDPVTGQSVTAFVVLASGARTGTETAERLREHVKSRIAPFKAPAEVVFVDELPRTAGGKLRRQALRP